MFNRVNVRIFITNLSSFPVTIGLSLRLTKIFYYKFLKFITNTQKVRRIRRIRRGMCKKFC